MSSVAAARAWEECVVEGKFPLQRWLGGSDHSAVFLTQRPGQTPPKAAIKLIEAAGTETQRAEADRLLINWRSAAQLSHPNLIRIFEFGRCQLNGTPLVYVVMEYADEDLSQILPQRPLAPAEVADLLAPLLDALSYVHGQGLVHTRIRPSNVLAVGDQLKLSTDRMAPSMLAGSELAQRDIYDAPEIAAGILSPAGDLWSLGVMLVAALTQDLPAVADPQRDPAIPKTMAEPFRGIARECLHLDPRRRCSIDDIQARLQPAARSVAAEPEPMPPPPSTGNRGRVVGALLAVALLVGLVALFSRGRSGRTESPTPASQPAAQTAAAPPEPASPQAKPAPTVAAPVRHAPVALKETSTSSAGAIVQRVIPDVPASARRTITGKVKVSVRVDLDASGKVTAARFVSPGPSKYFASLALKAAQGWEFSPAGADGQPAASAWLLQFRFSRGGTEVLPERVKQ